VEDSLFRTFNLLRPIPTKLKIEISTKQCKKPVWLLQERICREKLILRDKSVPWKTLMFSVFFKILRCRVYSKICKVILQVPRKLWLIQ